MSDGARRLPRRALLRIAVDVFRDGWALLFGGAWGGGWQIEKYWQVDLPPWLFAVLFAGLLLGAACWRWWHLRVALRADVVYLRKGRWYVQEVTLPWTRVEGLQLTQPVISRVLGLYDVNVESAGAGSAAVHLPGVDEPLLSQLRAHSQHTKTAPAAAEAATGDGAEVLYRLTTPQVLGVALTSWRTLLAAPALYWLADQMNIGDALVRHLAPAEAWVKTHVQTVGGRITVVAVSGLLSLLGILLVAMVWGVWRYHGFRLIRRHVRHREEWLQASGLVARYAQTLPVARVCALTWTQNPIMRLFGRGELHCAAIGDADADSGFETHANSSFRLPWRTPREWLALRNRLFAPELRTKATRHQGLQSYYLQRNRKYVIGPPTALLLLAGVLPFWPAWPCWVAAALYAALGEWQNRLCYRHWRFACAPESIRVQWGGWSRTQVFVPWGAVQRVVYEQSPGERRHQVASLSLVLPFTTLTIPALALDDALAMFNLVSAKTLHTDEEGDGYGDHRSTDHDDLGPRTPGAPGDGSC